MKRLLILSIIILAFAIKPVPSYASSQTAHHRAIFAPNTDGTFTYSRTDKSNAKGKSVSDNEGLSSSNNSKTIENEDDPARKTKTIKTGLSKNGRDRIEYTEEELLLVAKTVMHEANNQGKDGWIAVAEVIYNRYFSKYYPNDIKEIIYQKGQFASSWEIEGLEPSDVLISTVKDVLEGNACYFDNTDVLYFRATQSKEDWGKFKYYTTLGGHSFYLQDTMIDFEEEFCTENSYGEKILHTYKEKVNEIKRVMGGFS